MFIVILSDVLTLKNQKAAEAKICVIPIPRFPTNLQNL